MLSLIYPEYRQITEQQVIDWANDLRIDDRVKDHVKSHGTFDDDGTEYERFVATIPKITDVNEAKALLEDLGAATFAEMRGERFNELAETEEAIRD